jgi:hypothetical protein
MQGEQDLPAGRVRESRDHLLDRFELLVLLQVGSTSQMADGRLRCREGALGYRATQTEGDFWGKAA